MLHDVNIEKANGSHFRRREGTRLSIMESRGSSSHQGQSCSSTKPHLSPPPGYRQTQLNGRVLGAFREIISRGLLDPSVQPLLRPNRISGTLLAFRGEMAGPSSGVLVHPKCGTECHVERRLVCRTKTSRGAWIAVMMINVRNIRCTCVSLALTLNLPFVRVT